MAGGCNRKVDYPQCGLIGYITVLMYICSIPAVKQLTRMSRWQSKILPIPETKHRHSVSNYTSVSIIHIPYIWHRTLVIQSFTLHYLS